MSNLSQFMTSVKSIQRGTIILTTTATSNTATITSVNTAKSTLRNLGVSYDGTALGESMIRIVLTNATTITATRGLGSSTGVVSYELTEFY